MCSKTVCMAAQGSARLEESYDYMRNGMPGGVTSVMVHRTHSLSKLAEDTCYVLDRTSETNSDCVFVCVCVTVFNQYMLFFFGILLCKIWKVKCYSLRLQDPNPRNFGRSSVQNSVGDQFYKCTMAFHEN